MTKCSIARIKSIAFYIPSLSVFYYIQLFLQLTKHIYKILGLMDIFLLYFAFFGFPSAFVPHRTFYKYKGHYFLKRN
jgi:hypothetical protein